MYKLVYVKPAEPLRAAIHINIQNMQLLCYAGWRYVWLQTSCELRLRWYIYIMEFLKSNNGLYRKQVTEKTNISAVNSGHSGSWWSCMWTGHILQLRSVWYVTILTRQDLFMKLVAHRFTMFMIMCLSVCPGPCSVMTGYLCVYLAVIWRWITAHPCGFSITPVTGQAVVMTCESSVLLSGYVGPP